MSVLTRPSRRSATIFGGYAVAFAVAGSGTVLGLPPLVRFALATVALAFGAVAVGESTERLSTRLSPAATGIVQSVLGNLPELFLSIFALQAGLIGVVTAALVGSVLGNALFVLGIALLAGGLRHGTLRFSVRANQMLAVQLLLGIAALAIPFLAVQPGAPDVGHDVDISRIVAVVLLAIFALSVPVAIRAAQPGPGARPSDEEDDASEGAAGAGAGTESGGEPLDARAHSRHPLGQTLALLGISGASAAFVADWFVEALRPAMGSLGMSEAFAGLIVVALAGNAVENLAGVRAAWRGRADLALSLILNSALQVVLFLWPVIVLISAFVAPASLTFILSPLLLGALVVSVLLVFAIVLDGEANALEGAALLGLYLILAAAVWWGPPIGA
jgi:Ca2+:H+ antiporter